MPVRTFFYDAVDEQGSANEQDEVQDYLQRVEQLPDTSVRTGYLRRRRDGRRVQKAVDVQLAVDALEAAMSGVVGAIVLVAGDADFAPLAEAIRRAGPHVLVVASRRSLSAELRDGADRFQYLPDNWPAANWALPS